MTEQDVTTTDEVKDETVAQTEDTQPKEPQIATNDEGDFVIDLNKVEDQKEDPKEEEKAEDAQNADTGEASPRETKLGQDFNAEEQKDSDANDDKEQEKAEPKAEDNEKEAITQPAVPDQPEVKVPENLEKLVSFMEETGGTLEDFVNLNKDYADMEPTDIIKQYYKATKPYLTDDQIQRQITKKFGYDEDVDDVDEIEDKKIAFSEELFKAKDSLEKSKEKYYADLKFKQTNQLPAEAQEAVEFFNTEKSKHEVNQQLQNTFINRSKEVFEDPKFKGFEFNVGNHNNPQNEVVTIDTQQVMGRQLDINNFVQKFLGEDGTVTKAADYHKALYVADNADAIAQHFYNLGFADSKEESDRNAKGINMGARKDASSNLQDKESQFKLVDGNEDEGKFRLKV